MSVLPSVRAEVLARDGLNCFYCGKDTAEDPTLDHMMPKARGGSDSATNLVVCCRDCNTQKSTMDVTEFYQFLNAAKTASRKSRNRVFKIEERIATAVGVNAALVFSILKENGQMSGAMIQAELPLLTAKQLRLAMQKLCSSRLVARESRGRFEGDRAILYQSVDCGS